MKKIMLMLILGMFLISFVSAEGDLGVFKQGDAVELYQLCDTCTYVNLTSIVYPNSTVLDLDVTMTRDGTDYTYDFSNTFLLGKYTYTVCGDKGGGFKCEDITFEITPSGDRNVLGLFIIIIAIVYGIGFIGFFGKNEWVSIMGGLAMLILGIYFVQNGIDVYRNFMTLALSYFTIGLGAIFVMVPVFELLNWLDFR